jgi:phosphopantothenoylcysteine decarboxylase / phosphopantothenate---cysteine ligase
MLDLAGRRVLISAGPTYEYIDPVRFLGNRSSGKMGFALAAEAARRHAHVDLVAGPVHLETPPGVIRHDIETALEMQAAVNDLVPAADLIVMTAAVADFRIKNPAMQKIKKERGLPTLELELNPDILAGLRDLCRPSTLIVGFAAETVADEAEAFAKLARKRCDFLVWNDVSQRGIGFGADDNEVIVYRPQVAPLRLGKRAKAELASDLIELFATALTLAPAGHS